MLRGLDVGNRKSRSLLALFTHDAFQVQCWSFIRKGCTVCVNGANITETSLLTENIDASRDKLYNVFSFDSHYDGHISALQTCTWLHATTHEKTIFRAVLGKALPFLLSRSVCGEQHILWRPTVSLLKGFVLLFLQSGYASDRCVRPTDLLAFCGNWSAR